ncbi:copper resistance CopC family protein [Micromonospora mangrovi]|uniref:Copper resistance CopC family protein n=2 Tax=Micromonospora TaxID=1873 RepID=A0AAU8HDR4_9ACTN
MTPAADRPAPRPGAAAAVAVMVAVVVGILAMMYAGGSAPVRLSGVTPGDGASLAAGPSQVTLSFSGTPKLGQAHLTVVGPDGATVSRGLPARSGSTVVQPVNATGAGRYQVAYHVELTDGTQFSGVTAFTVGQVTGDAAAVPAPTAVPAGHQHEMQRDATTLVLVLVDLVLVGVVVVVLLPRRRRVTPDAPAQERRPV